MYPKNAASPPRIAIGAVVQISDGAVQSSGVSVAVRAEGGSESAGGGTISYGGSSNVVYYTPTQAETNYTAFVVTAYKTGCIPVAVTVVTTAESTSGKVSIGSSQSFDNTGNLNGNVSGSVGSVTGAVGSVTGSVGSVTGNVGGSVASVAGAVGSVAGDVSGKVLGGGSGTISGDGVRASSVTGAVGSVTGAVGSVTGTVGGIAGTIQTFDAIWTKIKNWLSCLAGKTADTTTRAEINATTAGANYNETTDSQEAIRDRGDEAWTTGAGGGTVTVTPLSAGDVQRVVGTDIEAYIDETADITVSSLTDANGDPVDLSGETLKLCIEDLHGADVEIIANGDITVSGAGNDTITFTPAAATTAQARTLEWALRRTSDNYRFAGGKLNVIYAPNGEPS